jgi:hypothetical protein
VQEELAAALVRIREVVDDGTYEVVCRAVGAGEGG